MSLYAEYLQERTNDKILELDFGFATYRHLPEQNATYIIDIYVQPKFRQQGLASTLANEITKEAVAIGHTKLMGSVVPTCRGSTEAMKALFAYGMHLKISTTDFIILEKDI